MIMELSFVKVQCHSQAMRAPSSQVGTAWQQLLHSHRQHNTEACSTHRKQI